MDKKNKEIIKKLEKSIQEFTDYFIKRYFVEPEWYLIGDDIGGVLYVNDHFFDFKDMIDYVRYDYTFDEMAEHYEARVENKIKINIKNWKDLKK